MKIERIDAVLASLRPSGGFSFTDLEHAELLHLLRCARAWAELEEWLTDGRVFSFERRSGGVNGVFAERGRWICDARKHLDLLSATEDALAHAKETT